MERTARRLAHNVSASLGYDDEKERVVAYGLIAIIQVAVTVALVILFGLLFHVVAEALVICFSVSILRRYSGGAHAGSIEECTATSVIYCICFALVSRRLLLPVLGGPALLAADVIVYALAFWACVRLAPVDSKNKPIRTAEKRRRMKRDSVLVLSVYLVLSALFLLFGFRYRSFFSVGTSLLFGVAWQSFTLTRGGAGLLNKIDFIINKVFLSGKEVDHE